MQDKHLASKLHTLSGTRRSVPLLLAQRALQTVISDHFASFRQTIHSGPTPKPGSWPLKADLKPVTAEKSKWIGYCQRGFLFHATTAAVHRVWVKPRNSFSKICHVPWSCMLNLFGVWRPYAAPQLQLLLVYLQPSSPQTSPWCLCDILCSLWLEGGSSQSHSTSALEPALCMSEERNKVRPKTHYSLFALKSKLYIPRADSLFITCVHVLTGSSVISMVVESRMDTSPLITYWLGPSSSMVPL